MLSTIFEVDEDVFQITTEHDDGRVTVETVFGRDAYELHAQKERQAHGQRDEHTSLAGYFSEYYNGPVARGSNREGLLN